MGLSVGTRSHGNEWFLQASFSMGSMLHQRKVGYRFLPEHFVT
jgi:hypothetical protein